MGERTGKLRIDAKAMIDRIIKDNLPDEAVKTALKGREFADGVYVISIGKAAWTMANVAADVLGDKLIKGIVITKYDHSMGSIPKMDIYEAGHPIIDENSLKATRKVIELAQRLGEGDELLLLLSGGGSALFEAPLEGVTLEDLQQLSADLLSAGCDIVEINMIRKRLSSVKAGRFAQITAPAKIFAVVLSDVLGDRLDTISSGPAAPDASIVSECLDAVKKYGIILNEIQKAHLTKETPKILDNVETTVVGSVRSLCDSAALSATFLGYAPHILTTMLNCEAKEAGRFLAAIAKDIDAGISHFKRPCAVICGGETVVNLKGNGKGGRNQELALAAAEGLAGLKGAVLFSLGSDGTDGPTDAAGGIVDGDTKDELGNAGFTVHELLANNDAYTGLSAVDGLIITGPTGTNVNDVVVLLMDK